MMVLDEQMVIRRRQVHDGRPQGLVLRRLLHGKLAMPCEQAGQDAHSSPPAMLRDHDGRGEIWRERPENLRERLEPVGGAADRDDTDAWLTAGPARARVDHACNRLQE